MSATVRLGLAVVASPLEVGAGDAPLLLARLHAAWAGAGFQELVLWLRRAATPIEIADGCARVPQGPGLGVQVDESVTQRYLQE